MEGFLVALGLGGYIVYKIWDTSTTLPQPKDGNKSENALPAPRFLYSNPAIWTSAPVDITYRPYNSFFGPNNDPRKAFLLFGGSRVVHSGYNPVGQTNLVWPVTYPSQPAGRPGYTPQPVIGTGEMQRVSSKTVFDK